MREEPGAECHIESPLLVAYSTYRALPQVPQPHNTRSWRMHGQEPEPKGTLQIQARNPGNYLRAWVLSHEFVFLNLQSLVSDLQSCQARPCPHDPPPMPAHMVLRLLSVSFHRNMWHWRTQSLVAWEGSSGQTGGAVPARPGLLQGEMLGSIAGHMDLVTGVHSLLANSLTSLCGLTVYAGSCPVCPEAWPASVTEDGCFT